LRIPISIKGFQDEIKEIMVNSKNTALLLKDQMTLDKLDISEEKSS